MGVLGVKGVFEAPSNWESHFESIETAVNTALHGKSGHPVAVYLLELIREVAGIFAQLMDSEEHRDYYLRKPTPTWLRTSQPCPWDWNTMRPVLQKEPFADYEELRPTHHEEAAAWLALSHGLVWISPANKVALLHGLEGLSAFPEGLPSPSSWEGGKPRSFGIPNIVLAQNLATALGHVDGSEDSLPLAQTRSEIIISQYGFLLPKTVRVGRGHSAPIGSNSAPFENLTNKLLGSDLSFWSDLFFKGETHNLPWEVNFAVLCRGIELDTEDQEARWVFDVTMDWFPAEPGEVNAKLAAQEWSESDWDFWKLTIQSTADKVIRRLRGGSGKAIETKKNLPISFLSGEGVSSVLGGQQIKFLGKPAPNPSKVASLEDSWEQRLKEGLGILTATGEKPEWLRESRSRNTGGYELAKTEKDRIREELGRSRHGVVEIGPGGTARWVRIGQDARGKRWEFHLGGKWNFLDEGFRNSYKRILDEEDKDLENKEKSLLSECEGSLFPPLEELEGTRKRRELNQARRGALTSWGRAMKVLARLRAEQASQRQETIEVDAETFKLWIWGVKPAPDNWLATVRETLGLLVDISATVVGITQGAGAALISYEYRSKDAPEAGSEAAASARGSNLVFLVTLNKALTGALDFLKSGPKTLPSGVTTFTYDTSEKNRKLKEKAIEEAGDRLEYSPEVHLDHFLEVLGHSKEEQTIAKEFAGHITTAGASVSNNWVKKRTKNEDGSIERRYTNVFCPLIPENVIMHGALGNFKRTPEHGWKMAGRHAESRGSHYSLLEIMGIDVTTGRGDDRKVALLKGFHALHRVVVELGHGLLAVRLSDRWHDLSQPTEEALLLHYLKEGRIFPFFQPGWIQDVRKAYETKTGRELPKSAEEAAAARWKKPTDESGTPLIVLLEAAIERRGMTQLQAAEALGVSRMTVSNWIKGRKPLSSENEAKVRAWITAV